jgi:hypothetical protein
MITLDQLPSWSEHVNPIEGHPSIRNAEARLRFAKASLAQSLFDEKLISEYGLEYRIQCSQLECVKDLLRDYTDDLFEAYDRDRIDLSQLSTKLAELAEIVLVLAWEAQERTNG